METISNMLPTAMRCAGAWGSGGGGMLMLLGADDWIGMPEATMADMALAGGSCREVAVRSRNRNPQSKGMLPLSNKRAMSALMNRGGSHAPCPGMVDGNDP